MQAEKRPVWDIPCAGDLKKLMDAREAADKIFVFRVDGPDGQEQSFLAHLIDKTCTGARRRELTCVTQYMNPAPESDTTPSHNAHVVIQVDFDTSGNPTTACIVDEGFEVRGMYALFLADTDTVRA